MKYSFLPVWCIQKPLLSHRRMRLAHWLQFLNKIDLRFVGPYSPCSQALLCNYEEQKPKYRSSRQSYLSGYCTDYFRRRAWLPTQSAAKPQNSFFDSSSQVMERGGWFWPQPRYDYVLPQSHTGPNGESELPRGEWGQRAEGQGPGDLTLHAASRQAGKLYWRVFLNPP